MKLAVLSALTLAASAQDVTNPLRMCVSNGQLAACEASMALLNDADGTVFSCVELPEAGLNCVDFLSDPVYAPIADFTRASAVQQYDSSRMYGLTPIVTEDDNNQFVSGYTAIAVVRKDSGITALQDLRGQNACMTAFGRTAGWQFPIGYLVNQRIIDDVDIVNKDGYIPNDMETVADFFGDVCAPSIYPKEFSPLCGACADDCTRDSDSNPGDLYAGYGGVLRGLQARACDVAFTKYFSDVANLDTDMYELIGPEGRCSIANFGSDGCNFGKNSAPVIAVNPLMSDANKGLIRDAFENADQTFIDTVKANGIFGSSLVSLEPVNAPDMRTHMGTAYGNYEGTRKARYPARWCPKVGERNKCNTMIGQLNQFETPTPTSQVWSCTAEQESEEACMELIQDGRAELARLGVADGRLEDRGHRAFDAFYENGMRIVMEEDYGDWHADSYYSVALVKKNSGINDIRTDIEGKRVCSTGYGNTAGWDLPVGFLLQNDIMGGFSGDGTVPNDIFSFQSFFGPSCAPQHRGSNSQGICETCPEHCDTDFLDLYSGFKGAFRCLATGVGEVAFVKGETVYQFAEDGSDPKGWVSGTQSFRNQFQLLCADGTTMDIDGSEPTYGSSFYECNVGKLPAAAIGTGSHTTHLAFTAMQETLIRAEIDTTFRATYFDGSGILFNRDTRALLPALAGTADYLGDSFDLFQEIDDLNAGNTGQSPPPPPASSSGLTDGEAAGLAFAMLGVGVGLTFLAGYGVKKYRGRAQGAEMQKSSFGGTLMTDQRAPDQI